MDRRFEWPPGQQQNAPSLPQNGHYPPPSSAPLSAAPPFPTNGYGIANSTQQPSQQLPQRTHSQSQASVSHPIVLIRRPSSSIQTYDEIRVQPRTPSQPRASLPSRSPSSGFQAQAPKIRTVQMPVQRSSHSAPGSIARTQPQSQTPRISPYQKPVGRSPSLQENRAQAHHQAPSHQPSQTRAPLQQHSTPKPRSQVQAVIQRPGPPTTPVTSGTAQSNSSKPPPQDYVVLLLAMAEEYMRAAYGMGPVAAISQREADLERYYKLIATSLGCMESVLKNYKIHPRSEAALRLKYASLLVEETDNSVEIEGVLSKGVALCQRQQFLDLKYSMQHLQARFLFKTNHRAALKSLDQPISDAETLGHIPWVYALRFLKVSLALQTSGHAEAAAALQQLNTISTHAHRHGDSAIYVASYALQALVHLRIPGPDSIEQAQRAIAAARSLQLETSASEIGQIGTLINILDLACSLQQNSASEMGEKRKLVQADVDNQTGEGEDSPGVFSVLIERSSGGKLTELTGGIFKKDAEGRDEITFNWLSKRDLYTLGYYLSGIVGFMKGEVRTPVYLNEGIRTVRDQKRPIPESIQTSLSSHHYRLSVEWQMTFLLALLACNQGRWDEAERLLTSLREQASKPPFTNSKTHERLIMYFTAALAQATGSLNKALSIYQSHLLTLPQTATHTSDFNTDIALLATMNQIIILRDPTHPQHYQTSQLVSQIEPLCLKHPNTSLHLAFNMIRIITSPRDSKLSLKSGLATLLPLAKKVENFQFITMGLNLMGQLFFSDTLGDQAQKSVRAARSSARSSGIPVWQAVASGLLMTTLQRHGQFEQVGLVGRELSAVWDRLPPQLRGEVVKKEDVEMGL